MASPFVSNTSEGFYNSGSAADPTASFVGEEGGMARKGGAGEFRTAMAALYLVVCVAGLSGNALVIAATLKLDRLGSATTVYIFNLALADGLFMVGLPFIAVQNFRNSWPFGDPVCKLVMVLDGINQFTSVFCLTAMSVDRYVVLALGPGSRLAAWRTPRRAKAVAACLWLLSLAPVLPMATHFSASSGLCAVEPPPPAPRGSSSSLDGAAWWLVFLTYTFVLGFALPFGVMIAAYAALLVAVRARSRQGRRGDDDHGDAAFRSPEARRRERQATRMVVAVVTAFAACWLPFYTLNFCALRQGGELAPPFARGFEIAVLLSYAWSCANPVLYACLSDAFRTHFRALLCRAKGDRCDAVTEGFDLRDASDGDMSQA
ncbi:hypothetical protein AAFF_G00353260 [Aldrovandia affinis]|uniref:G-protein coupled receptors family 1 profile domain-containing protein n=1 Tax=Aldrovandia affinis TaxID=143900 RepID=A0AAD7R5L9_9TELE|nr:hypothetical protein AAFF_G00353260 [Aldrovandia affinis]